MGKTPTWHVEKEVKEAAGPLQTCAGHGAGAEAAIHAMSNIFKADSTDAFNRLNRAAAMHNIRIICPEIATYVINTHIALPQDYS